MKSMLMTSGAATQSSAVRSPMLSFIMIGVLLVLIVLSIVLKKKHNGNMEVNGMARRKRNIPAAKPITFLAFGFLVAIAVLFLSGLIQGKGVDEAINVSYVIDFVKEISKDLSAYFKGLGEGIKLAFKGIEDAGFGDVAVYVLFLVSDLIILFFFLGVAWNLLFCWTPLAKVGKIGWSRASIRMSKKLKKVLGWALGYIVYNFMVYGRSTVELTVMGKIAIYAVAVFVVLRILLKHIASGDNIVHIILSTLSAVATAVFMMMFFLCAISFLVDGDSVVMNMVGYMDYAFEILKSESSTADEFVTMLILIMLSLAFILVFANTVKNAMARQVEDKGGIRGAMIALLIWGAIIIALNYFGYKQGNEDLKFGDWKKIEVAKYMVKVFIYAAVGLGISIVTSILCSIGKQKVRSNDDEDGEDEE